MSPCSMYTDDDFGFEGFSETYLFYNSVALSGEKSGVYNLFMIMAARSSIIKSVQRGEKIVG